MGKKETQVSHLSIELSEYLRAEMAVRKIKNKDLARLIDRGETYVSERMSGSRDWMLTDLEAIADAWQIDPADLLHAAREAYYTRHIDALVARLGDGVPAEALGLVAKRGDIDAEQESYVEEP